MNPTDPFRHPKLWQLQLSLYLLPVFGFFPALWTLYRRNGSREEQSICRLSITLTLGWLLLSGLLTSGSAQTTGLWQLRLLYLDSLVVSGYFLVSLFLILRLWQGKLPRLPVLTQIAESSARKHLS
ncbi:MAG: hypothetical protein HC890_09625 [Chloroflexaceae bacterium]|nr:hypothetical protein [Chloroflexaceae bacterium]